MALAEEGLERRRTRWPLTLLGFAVAALVVALGVSAFSRSVVYYLSPTELLTYDGDDVRVSGTVVDGSIVFHPEVGTVSFDVTDGETTLTVEHEGPAPDTLKDGAEAVAEGELLADGTFRATKVFAKCPSKFESEHPEEAAR